MVLNLNRESDLVTAISANFYRQSVSGLTIVLSS